jgi:hypothetical protein
METRSCGHVVIPIFGGSPASHLNNRGGAGSISRRCESASAVVVASFTELTQNRRKEIAPDSTSVAAHFTDKERLDA